MSECAIILGKGCDKVISSLKIDFPQDARIIVISDIHGSLEVLQALLRKVNYLQEEDYLILLGDFAQKGPQPLETLRYIMELSKCNKVYAVMGNCDHGNYKIFYPEYLETEFVLHKDCPNTLLYDMVQEYRKFNQHGDSLENAELQTELGKHFLKERKWIESLPLMVENNDLIFVHAGLDDIDDYHESNYHSVLMKRYFYETGHHTNKMVICGHMPVTIYDKEEFNDDIIIDYDKKIISIDGGMIVKQGGQLNALEIIKHGSQYEYHCFSQCDLPKAVLKRNSPGKKIGKGPCWPHFDVKVLQREKYFTKVEIIDTHEITTVKNEFLLSNQMITTVIDDCPSNILSIPKGAEVFVINNECQGYVLVKYHSIQGWIKKETIY